MDLTKKKRVTDPDLLAFIRTLPCLACGVSPCDAHHVTTRKSGGGDVPENVMPLCRAHHSLWHSMGAGQMCDRFPPVKFWLEAAGRNDVFTRINRVVKKRVV